MIKAAMDSENIYNGIYKKTLINAYDLFNRRDLDSLLSLMNEDVEWENGMDGGFEHGKEAVRSYWSRQWNMIDPKVEPIKFETRPGGEIDITVHQVVRNLEGDIILENIVHHIYTFQEERIKSMKIEK